MYIFFPDFHDSRRCNFNRIGTNIHENGAKSTSKCSRVDRHRLIRRRQRTANNFAESVRISHTDVSPRPRLASDVVDSRASNDIVRHLQRCRNSRLPGGGVRALQVPADSWCKTRVSHLLRSNSLQIGGPIESILQQYIGKIRMEVVWNMCHCTVFFNNIATHMIMEEMYRRNSNDCYDHHEIGVSVSEIKFVLRDVLNAKDHARITSMFGTRFEASEGYVKQFSKPELRPPSEDDKIIITYPGGAQSGSFVIRVSDYKCLDDGAYLNDVMIDFYLKYFVDKLLSAENRRRTHVFSSFFYQNIAPSPNENPGLANSKGRHTKVSKWTKHVNIFEKDFIIIPINLKPCILIFDSMPMDRGDVFTPILNYLTHEYEAKIYKTFRFSTNNMGVDTVVVPVQKNSWNCGLFLLEYVERFFTHPIKDFSIPILGLENWFDQSCIRNKRNEIRLIIQDLINQDEVVLPKLFETGQLLFWDSFRFIE
uniref:Ubiquitin-like protease family profile domain-containing protein n=1 Tax=Trichogramma kaykai TaxID=54128 RepID=A0ABD2WFU2_9HYME